MFVLVVVLLVSFHRLVSECFIIISYKKSAITFTTGTKVLKNCDIHPPHKMDTCAENNKYLFLKQKQHFHMDIILFCFLEQQVAFFPWIQRRTFLRLLGSKLWIINTNFTKHVVILLIANTLGFCFWKIFRVPFPRILSIFLRSFKFFIFHFFSSE